MANRKLPLTLVATFALTAPLLTGCWDRIETNDVAFVLSSSVDLEEDGRFRVAYQLPLPGSMGGASGGGGGTSGAKSYYIDSEVGKTFREATSKLQMRMSRKLFLAHRRTIIIGEALAKQGIALMFDVVPRSTDSRMTSFLVIAKGKGYELLNTTPKFERFPAEAIRELAKSSLAIPTSTKDIGLALAFHGDPFISYFEEKDSEGTNHKSKEVQLAGYAQFKGEKMVGVYKDREAQGLMWLRNKVKEHTLTFPVEDDKYMSILVSKGRTEIVPVINGDEVTFDLTLEAIGTVREDRSEQDLNNADNDHRIERKFADQVKKCVQATIKQMQKEGTDSAQLGLIVWRSHPKVWKERLAENWEETFKKARFNIKVEASVTETGLINQNAVKDGMNP